MSEEKYVDESWKDTVAKEKEGVPEVQPSKEDKIIHATQKETIPEVSEPKQDPPLQGTQNQKQEGEPDTENFDINFTSYITSLAYQAMVFLGEVPNPMDNTMTKNLQQAKLLIDTLSMLKIKTNGNLTKQEDDIFNQILYELQMKFVEAYNQKEP